MFWRHGANLLVLLVALAITWLLPEDKRIQIVAPIIMGIVMLSLNSILGRPDVVIEDLGNTVTCHSNYPTRVYFSVKGVLVNRSLTGSGDLKSLILRIFVTEKDSLDIQVHRGEPDIVGFRFLPHGIFPTHDLDFEETAIDIGLIRGKRAEIWLNVVGQSLKKYPIKIET